MTYTELSDLIQSHIAKTGSFELHLLMSAYTLDSFIKESHIPVVLSGQSHTTTIMGYPVFLNDQVPNGSVYLMLGKEPTTPAPYIAWEGGRR